MKIMILAQVAFTVFLLVASLFDFYRQEIPVYLYAAAAFTGITNIVSVILAAVGGVGSFQADVSYVNSEFLPITPAGVVSALMPFLVLLLLYKAGGGVGLGDVLVFLVSFLYLPGYINMELFAYAVLVSGLVGIGIYVWGMWKGKNAAAITFPFIPCVFTGWLMVVWFRVGGTYV